MAMLSLSVSCIHLELSATKSPKEQALVLSMILFQRGRKMTELCATRMELDYAFVEFPQLLLRSGLPRVSTASSRCQSDCTFQVIARAAGVHSASDAKTANDGWRRNPQLRLHLRHTCRGSWCRHERWKFEWGKPHVTRLKVRKRAIRVVWPAHDNFRSIPLNGQSQE